MSCKYWTFERGWVDQNPQLKDLTGQRFGRLTIVRRSVNELGHLNGSEWWCACDCGIGKKINGSVLRRGGARSCGCLWRERISLATKRRLARTKIIGRQFGRLKVIRATVSSGHRSKYKCICICGKTCVKSRKGLISGTIKDCGCASSARASILRSDLHYKALCSMAISLGHKQNRRTDPS